MRPAVLRIFSLFPCAKPSLPVFLLYAEIFCEEICGKPCIYLKTRQIQFVRFVSGKSGVRGYDSHKVLGAALPDRVETSLHDLTLLRILDDFYFRRTLCGVAHRGCLGPVARLTV